MTLSDETSTPRSTGSTSAASSSTDLEDENVSVDALTGEVISGATEDDDDEPAGVVTFIGKSPRVGAFDFQTNAYGEEQLDVSRDDFEALLQKFEEDFQVGNIREGEIVKAKVL